MAEVRRLNRDEYHTSDIRLFCRMADFLSNHCKIEIETLNNEKLSFSLDVNDNILNDVLTIVSVKCMGIKKLHIRHGKSFIKIDNSVKNNVTYEASEYDTLDHRIELIKKCSVLKKIEIIKLEFDNIDISDVIKISNSLGAVLNGTTVNITDDTRLHIIKYRSFGLLLIGNELYIIEALNNDPNLLDNISQSIKKHFVEKDKKLEKEEKFFIS